MNKKTPDYIEFFSATKRNRDRLFNLIYATQLGWINIAGSEETVAEFEEALKEFDVTFVDPDLEKYKEMEKAERQAIEQANNE